MPTQIIIRPARLSDAARLNAYIRAIYSEQGHLITRPEEFRVGRWRQRLWLAKKLANPLEICLLALEDQQIVGMLDNWVDGRKRVRHTTAFAMSVSQHKRGRGIGKKLLCHFIKWVQKHEILERIELHVHDDNIAAKKLYESVGFQCEGKRQGVVRYEDGRTVDDHIMALWPNQAHIQTKTFT